LSRVAQRIFVLIWALVAIGFFLFPPWKIDGELFANQSKVFFYILSVGSERPNLAQVVDVPLLSIIQAVIATIFGAAIYTFRDHKTDKHHQ
jgi:hypothetical protein